MNTVLDLCLKSILSHLILLAIAPRRVEPPARLADAIPLLQELSDVAQGLSGEVGPAVATMRLTVLVVAAPELLLPPPITSLPLLNHNFLHSHRLLHHLLRRYFAALEATGVP